MADDIRDKARIYMQVMPAMPGEIPSNGTDKERALFQKLTGTTHESLLESWAVKKTQDRTTCNDFAGQFSIAMVGTNLGKFELEAELRKIGKAHSWVKAEGDARPKCGDVFRAKTYHMGVFLDFDGDQINSAEGGQGGRLSRGYDILKLKRGGWNVASYIGWCDIEKFAEKAPKPDIPEFTGPVPERVGGWWKIWWYGQACYFHFDNDRVARWTKLKPRSASDPAPTLFNDKGPLQIDVQGGVVVQWEAKTEWTDVLTRDPKDERKMSGMRNDTIRLVATRDLNAKG